MLLENEEVLFFCPLLSDDIRVEYVMPSLTALAPQTSWDVSLNNDPVLDAELLDFFPQEVILLLSPLIALDGLIFRFSVAAFAFLVVQLEPSLEAPNLGFVWHESAKPVPRVLAINLDQTD